MNYRMTASLPIMALYRCEYCHNVSLHQVLLKKRTNYDSTWTQSSLERRRERKQEELSQKLSKAAEAVSSNNKALTFVGKTIDGKCPHCNKKQSWMRMSYSLWGSLIGVLVFIVVVGFFSIHTFEGSYSQLHSMQTILSAVIMVLILLTVGLFIHAIVMLTRTKRITQESPIFLARTTEELFVKAAEQPEYLKELEKTGSKS